MKVDSGELVSVAELKEPIGRNRHFIIKGRYTDLIDGTQQVVLTDTTDTYYRNVNCILKYGSVTYGEYKIFLRSNNRKNYDESNNMVNNSIRMVCEIKG